MATQQEQRIAVAAQQGQEMATTAQLEGAVVVQSWDKLVLRIAAAQS